MTSKLSFSPVLSQLSASLQQVVFAIALQSKILYSRLKTSAHLNSAINFAVRTDIDEADINEEDCVESILNATG